MTANTGVRRRRRSAMIRSRPELPRRSDLIWYTAIIGTVLVVLTTFVMVLATPQVVQVQSGRPGGVSFGPPTTQAPYEDYTGFTKIFDGQTFANWNGERDVWSIVDGMLHADTTKTPGQHHIFYDGPNPILRDSR